MRQLNLYLTDAYAQLLSGQIDHPALRSAAAQAGLIREGARMPSSSPTPR